MKTKSFLYLGAVVIAGTFLSLAMTTTTFAQTALTGQLDVGDQGAQVTALQQFLARDVSIYPEALVTGYYGVLTEAAVKRYQVAQGISAVGRVGPQTLAAINGRINDIGQSPSGDVWAPRIFPETVTVGSTSATFSWVTSEAAKSRVMYGTTWPFLYATAPSVSTAGFGSTANITLTNLQSNTTYYYVLESVDASGNVMWTVMKPLKTQ